MLIRCLKLPGVFDQMPEPCLGLRREAGRAEKWPNSACSRPSYGGKVNACIVSEICSFKIGGPPLQDRVVGPYLVRSEWFPNRLLLEETGRIQNFGR
jgi:hypothetical protein